MRPPKAMQLLAASAMQIRDADQNDQQFVPSPCVSACHIDQASGLCCGCLRTLDEIVRWGNADAAFKRAVWARLLSRAQLQQS